MVGVLGQQFLFEFLDAVHVARAVEIGALLHGREGRPTLGVHDVRAREGFGHVVRPRKRTAGCGGVAAGHLLDAAHDFIAFGMRQHDVHAETGH